MSELRFNCPKGLHQMLLNRDLEIEVLLNEVLFANIEGNQTSLAELKETLLSFSAGDGGFPEIIGLEIIDVLLDLSTGKGQVLFGYTLGYNNTCAGTRTDVSNKDRMDFRLDPNSNKIIFSFIDLEQRSTADEF